MDGWWRPLVGGWWRRPPAPGSRRSVRQRALSELRAQGRAGPTLRDALPGFVALVLVIVAPLLLLVWLYRLLDVLGLAIGLGLLGTVAAMTVSWRQTAARRRRGIYRPTELDRLTDRGLAMAVERMLKRDGWHVVPLPDESQPRLYASDTAGRELDVALRPSTDASADESSTTASPLREAGRAGVDHFLRLVISKGSYSREDVLWANRQGGVHLLDGQQLHRWASGSTLDQLGLPSGDYGR